MILLLQLGLLVSHYSIQILIFADPIKNYTSLKYKTICQFVERKKYKREKEEEEEEK